MTNKAKFQASRNDLHWSLYTIDDGFIRWTGYDDANWWDNVSVRPEAYIKIGQKTGTRYIIDFKTCEVRHDR